MKKVEHGTRAHSLMSPSSFHRVIGCPGSVNLCKDIPEPPTNPAAAEGTDAHEWAETILREGDFDALPYVGMTRDLNARAVPLTAEMANHLNVYLEHVKTLLDAGSITELYVETRVSLAKYFGNDDGDGTADAMVYDVERKHLDVIDLKYGAGIMVTPDNNPQALQYALGAIEGFADRGVNSVTVWIVQPRGDNGAPKGWTCDLADLYDWRVTVRQAIAAARAPDAPLRPGSHCRYCKANPMRCPALAAKVRAVAAEGFAVPSKLTPYDLGARLKDAKVLGLYLSALEELAKNEARAGRMPSGYKWIEAQTNREWANPVEAEKWIFDLELVPHTSTLKSPAQIEKELPKADAKTIRAEFEKLIVRRKYPRLVEDSHKQPAVDFQSYKSAEGFTPVTE